MVENEKLGFTFEVKPYDFRTFKRFFGEITLSDDDGSSVVPKVSRDNLYPTMSPRPLKPVQSDLDEEYEEWKNTLKLFLA